MVQEANPQYNSIRNLYRQAYFIVGRKSFVLQEFTTPIS